MRVLKRGSPVSVTFVVPLAFSGGVGEAVNLFWRQFEGRFKVKVGMEDTEMRLLTDYTQDPEEEFSGERLVVGCRAVVYKVES